MAPGKDKLYFVPLSEIRRVIKSTYILDQIEHAKILAQILRINILYMIKRAGSGHIGTSFSAIDIMLWLWLYEMREPNSNGLNADAFFSSKGHDAPALYAVLTALEKLPFDYVHKLRRLGGLPGHPDIHTPFIATNTGSLGMGISKAKGMAMANRLDEDKGRIFVLTGDGELQEGQFWESLQGAVNSGLGNIITIVDHNKMQSDTWIHKTSDLGKIQAKLDSFGWFVQRINGHDFFEIAEALNTCRLERKKPHMIIADTIKGKGVSFMEKTELKGLYQYHSGAPSDEDYYRALEELTAKINDAFRTTGVSDLKLKFTDIPTQKTVSSLTKKLIPAYGNELVKIGRKRKDVIVLDADLAKDCGLLPFKKEFPDRFMECGIAEQDMVSVAGGLALRGKLPIVNSFACFLASRANEQIYNNATEKTKIIYAGHLAGLLPAGPGHSHQSVRDISILGSIPGLTLIQPCNDRETRLALNWATYQNPESTYIRLVTIPVELNFYLPPFYNLRRGYGVKIWEGYQKIAIIAYGPIMLREAVKAAQDIGADVFNFPWLNYINKQWLIETLGQYDLAVVIDDHYQAFGLGTLMSSMFGISRISEKNNPKILLLGLEEIPACGVNDEILKYHELDAKSIISRIKKSNH